MLTVDGEHLVQLRAATAATRFTVNPHPVAQGKATYNFRRDENVLRRLHKIALRIAEKTKAFSRDLDDAFAELRFALDLFARFGRAFQRFGGNGIASCGAGSVVSGGLVKIVAAIAAVVITPAPIATAPPMATLVGRSGRFGGFQRRLVFVFFVHKLQRPIARRGKRTARSSAKGNYFFRLATWPASRREYLDLSRRSAHRRRLRGHHTSAAPAGPRPHRQPEPCYQG